MKKILGSLLILGLVAAGFFNVKPANASEATSKSIGEVNVLAASTMTIWLYEKGPKKDYFFYSENTPDGVYRGYVFYDSTTSAGVHWYKGTLYRAPLPYPVP